MITLIPLSESEFQNYLAQAIPDYAAEHVKAGNWRAEEALQRSQKEYEGYFPQGLATPDNYLYAIHDEAWGQNVGMLWIAVMQRGPQPFAFVYDFRVEPQFQGRGYGTQAFLALEDKVRELGLSAIALHVFGHNHVARHLYEKLGYVATDIMMRKAL